MGPAGPAGRAGVVEGRQMGRLEVLRTYLEMTSPDQLEAGASRAPGLRVERVLDCPASFYRYLYTEVGRAYRWEDRLPWTDEQILSHLRAPEISLYVLYLDGAPAGY